MDVDDMIGLSVKIPNVSFWNFLDPFNVPLVPFSALLLKTCLLLAAEAAASFAPCVVRVKGENNLQDPQQLALSLWHVSIFVSLKKGTQNDWYIK